MPHEHYYEDIHGWTDFMNLYRDVIEKAADGDVLVEVGCWKGKSLSFLLVEAVKSGKQLRIIGVDHFQGSVGEPALQEEAARSDLAAICRANLERADYPFELLCEASPAAAAKFADASLAFVFIDASHDQDSVLADVKAWLPKVRPGGVIAGHDYGYPSVRFAVHKAIPEAIEIGSSWRYEVPPLPADAGESAPPKLEPKKKKATES